MTHSMRPIGRAIEKNVATILALCLVGLTMYIELEGPIVPENDTLDEADSLK